MSWDEISSSVCPIGRSLGLVGDRWTLLILRELGMGTHRFDELQAQTGMSSHLLTTRLKRLEKDGIIERRLYTERPPRYEYHATAKGKELDPILMMLRSWGRKWEGDCPPGESSCRLVHKKSGIELDHLWQVPPDDQPTFTFDDVEPTMGPTFAAEREERRAGFQAQQQAAKRRAAKART
ncbi:helix-turn-helix domain-containing protein [Rugamonas sp.]|uniref:winged helix-turn-helix transcriptional regulator n=1 Tax=Rugamonas sp. TaxID=1926287 RepID=UPI0025D56742|nr:helix-turn-helix domain-containing protein [Rugamonas sp.]